MNQDLFKEIYNEVYEMWEIENQDPENPYRKRTWIFPNHIDLVIDWTKKLSAKYNANEEICAYAALFHDIGLVYKRAKNTSPEGHEERSLEYTKDLLVKHNFQEYKINKILDCIKATEPGHEPQTVEEKIVSTSDFVSQFKSIHYFAKAVFADDINYFVKWFKKRIEVSFDKKIYFEDLREELLPIKKHYAEIIRLYEENK